MYNLLKDHIWHVSQIWSKFVKISQKGIIGKTFTQSKLYLFVKIVDIFVQCLRVLGENAHIDVHWCLLFLINNNF